MARTKEFDPDTVADRAMELFWRQGFESTSTTDLMEAMKIGKRSLYDTFGNKRDLYVRSLRSYVSRAETAHEAELAVDGDARSRLYGLLRAGVALPGRVPPVGCFAVNASTELASSDSEIRACVHRYFEVSEAQIATILRSGTNRNAVAVAELSSVIHAAWVGLRAQAASGMPDDDQDRLARRIAGLA